MKRILFVDDEQNVLDGLRNILRKQRKEWDMVFATGAAEALAEMAKAPFDVVVTDMRMPGMDGAALLTRVRDQHPGTARIVLSGHSEREAVVRALPVMHQFLNKPCDSETLKSVIERTCGLQRLLESQTTRAVIGKLDRLPSPPSTYFQLSQALANPNTSAKALAEIVEQDPAMSVKILQLVNSAYFGLAHRATSVAQAVSYLGVEVLRALALSAHVFGTIDESGHARALLDQVQRASFATASIARKMTRERRTADDAFTAGVVHDIGKIVMALSMPAEVREIATAAEATRRPPYLLEQETLNVTHAEVGAYLLGVWGLPFSIVETTAHHHTPSRAGGEPSPVLAAVHLANVVVDEQLSSSGLAGLDQPYLEAAGLWAELDDWRRAAAEFLNRADARAAHN
jgi:HD-like signal output (HDOD) protein